MKAVFPLLALLTAATACRATSPPDRNTLPRNQALTETTIPETGEPSRRAENRQEEDEGQAHDHR